MQDTASIIAIAAPIMAWLAKKAGDSAWTRLYRYFRSDRLVKQIENTLATDSEVAKLLSPAPTLVRERLKGDLVLELLKTAVTKDTRSLAAFLLNEQLIDLPTCPETRPDSYEAVWSCIANVVVAAVCAAVAQDEQLSRLFAIESAQLGHVEHQQIIELVRAQGEMVGQLLQSTNDHFDELLSKTSQPKAVTDSAMARTINLMSEQNEQLEERLRTQLDAHTEQLWDLILADIKRHNFRDATEKGKELESWLDANSPNLSHAVRGRAFLLLAQVALIESSEWGSVDDNCVRARQLLDNGKHAFGTDVSDENRIRLTNFEAKLLSSEGRSTEALALLSTATDSRSLTTRLLILVDDGMFDAGEALIDGLPIDDSWCDSAAFLYARIGDSNRWRPVLAWAIAHGEPTLVARCRVSIVRGTLSRLMAAHTHGAFSALSITPEAAAAVKEVVPVLSPIVDECGARKAAVTGIDADAVGLAYSCCRLLAQYGDARSWALLLKTHRPVHLEYANAILRGDVDTDMQAADHIRQDYPNWFTARFMALAIDLEAQASPKAIIDRASELARRAKPDDDRERTVESVPRSQPAAIRSTCPSRWTSSTAAAGWNSSAVSGAGVVRLTNAGRTVRRRVVRVGLRTNLR